MAAKEEEEKLKSNHHHHRRSMSFNFHVPHLGHEKDKAAARLPPKGWMAIRVGHEGEEQQRFVVPVVYLNHPLFSDLLHEAEEEYGFKQNGAIVIPCDVQHFLEVQDTIEHENCAAAHHHHYHHKQPHHLPCFGV